MTAQRDKPRDRSGGGPDRRRLLQGAVALAGAGPAVLLAAPARGAAASRRTPLAEGHGIVTPSAVHFERQRGAVPALGRARHRLAVQGLVARPRSFGMAELERLPAVSRFHFIECARNGGPGPTVQDSHGLTACAEWTGVPLAAVLRAVGVGADGAWLLAEGADGVSCSLPLGAAWHDALLAYGQNGAALRPGHGHPLRLILPGRAGSTHVKWLRRLEVSARPLTAAAEAAVVEARSVITVPSGGMRLPGAGFCEISGLAWSGRGGIERVEVSTDGGRSWSRAALQEPVLPICHTRFRCPWQWDGRPAVLQSRCVDETGRAQPALQSWRVAADGGVAHAS